MSCQTSTIVIIVCAIFVAMIILILQESYTPDNREKSYSPTINTKQIQLQNGNQNDNVFYQTGPFFLNEKQDGYSIYNAYKKDPNEQPINAPPVDYVNNPPSTLPKMNPMFAVPNPDVTFVNLLNPVRS